MAIGLSFSAVLDGLSFGLEFNSERHAAVLARVRSLVRDEFMSDGPAGRGSRVSYSLDRLTGFVAVLMLADAFIPPEPAMRLVEAARLPMEAVLASAFLSTEIYPAGGQARPDRLLLSLRPAALWQLREGTGQEVGEPDYRFHDHNRLIEVSREEACDRLSSNSADAVLFFDLGRRMYNVCRHIALRGWMPNDAVTDDLLSRRHLAAFISQTATR
jgi:hypothetical protein